MPPKMFVFKVLIFYFLLLLFLVGCSHANGELLRISGVVVDRESKVPLGKIVVVLDVFERDSIFGIGSYRPKSETVTGKEGVFEFTVEKGMNVQIGTMIPNSIKYGGFLPLGEISRDTLNIVIEHNN